MAQRSITPGQATWLRAELARWVGAGLVSAQSAEVITAEYAVRRRASLVGLVVGLGGAFLGIGIIWLVAANLEHLGLLSRFVLILALWLGLVARWLGPPPRIAARCWRSAGPRVMGQLACWPVSCGSLRWRHSAR